jgi:hypothetical protein
MQSRRPSARYPIPARAVPGRKSLLASLIASRIASLIATRPSQGPPPLLQPFLRTCVIDAGRPLLRHPAILGYAVASSIAGLQSLLCVTLTPQWLFRPWLLRPWRKNRIDG